jgi:hypothetical protein
VTTLFQRTAITPELAARALNNAGGFSAEVSLEPFDFTGTVSEIATRAATRGFQARWVKLQPEDKGFDFSCDMYELVLLGMNGVETYRTGKFGSWDHPEHSQKNHAVFEGSNIKKGDTFKKTGIHFNKGDCKLKAMKVVEVDGSAKPVSARVCCACMFLLLMIPVLTNNPQVAIGASVLVVGALDGVFQMAMGDPPAHNPRSLNGERGVVTKLNLSTQEGFDATNNQSLDVSPLSTVKSTTQTVSAAEQHT